MATHWGWYWKIKKHHKVKTLCSQLLSIDSFKFFKNLDFSGFTVQPIDIKATLHEDALHVTYGNRATHIHTSFQLISYRVILVASATSLNARSANAACVCCT